MVSSKTDLDRFSSNKWTLVADSAAFLVWCVLHYTRRYIYLLGPSKMSSQAKNIKIKPFKSKLPKFTFLKRTPKNPGNQRDGSSPTPSCKKEKELANFTEKAIRKNSVVETKIPVFSAKVKESTIFIEKR